MDEYTIQVAPNSLQCIPALKMSMTHSQYLSHNSGFVHTGISEWSLCFHMGFGSTGNTVCPYISVCQICETPCEKVC